MRMTEYVYTLSFDFAKSYFRGITCPETGTCICHINVPNAKVAKSIKFILLYYPIFPVKGGFSFYRDKAA